MEKARLRVALAPAGRRRAPRRGRRDASFLFAPNPGEPEKPLEKIASGGELSRLQLAIRSVAAGRKGRGRTLVFDEVDAGIGGRVAEVVGRKLRDLAAHDQVLCVTHVPQIAALADRHFLAEKREARGRTVASVRLLEGQERVAEIARMLAGEKVPETALKHAAHPARGGGAVSGDGHSRSVLFPGIGEEGQRADRAASRSSFVGVGAVGAAAAEMAVRAGFGRITLVDRDVVEESNLARQFLFDAEDAARVAPKAEAAAARLREIDPSLPVAAVVADLDARQRARDPRRPRPRLRRLRQLRDAAARLGRGARARDAVHLRGVRGRGGARRGVRSRRTPCLRCYLEALPPAGSGPTCDTAGVVPTLPPLVAVARR